jgi:hypothetical protein
VTQEELQAIRARFDNASRGYQGHAMFWSMNDVPKLIAEIERLRGALERIVEMETRHNMRGDVVGYYPSGNVAREALEE